MCSRQVIAGKFAFTSNGRAVNQARVRSVAFVTDDGLSLTHNLKLDQIQTVDKQTCRHTQPNICFLIKSLIFLALYSAREFRACLPLLLLRCVVDLLESRTHPAQKKPFHDIICVCTCTSTLRTADKELKSFILC